MLIMACDRSLRSYDHDGRLRVTITPISKANICPYYGKEIPDAQALGLDMERVYQLFRDPAELTNAAETANGIPILIKHRPVSPSDPAKDLVVGALGSSATFDGVYLNNSLTVWDQEAIDLINSEKQKELSCGYYYRADMIPGQFKGVSYDGVMRDIKFNHVALVENGRAGTDVMVADRLPFKINLKSGVEKRMSMISQRAALIAARATALAVYSQSKLAQDAEINFKKILAGTTAANWDTAKPQVIRRFTAEMKGKLAQDASLDDLPGVLDMLDEDVIAHDEWSDEDDDDDKKAKDKKARDAKAAKDKAAKDAKRAKDDGHDPDDEDKKTKDKTDMAERLEDESDEKKGKAEDEDDDDDDDDDDKKKASDRKGAKDRKSAKDDSPVPITMKAMDEALAKQRAELKAEQKALREAEDIVRPVLGAGLAADSAAEVYELLFKAEDIDVDGVPPAGYRALAQRVVSLHARMPSQDKTPAMDAKSVKSFAIDFPEAAAVRHI